MSRSIQRFNVPHTRGDEPELEVIVPAPSVMFPTHVGMNRDKLHSLALRVYVPHTRGDEPSKS